MLSALTENVSQTVQVNAGGTDAVGFRRAGDEQLVEGRLGGTGGISDHRVVDRQFPPPKHFQALRGGDIFHKGLGLLGQIRNFG